MAEPILQTADLLIAVSVVTCGQHSCTPQLDPPGHGRVSVSQTPTPQPASQGTDRAECSITGV